VTNSAIRKNHVLGLSIRGAIANLAATDVTGTLSGDTVLTGKYGGGLAASMCSNVSATRLRVLDNADYGVFIDGSKATLGDEMNADGVEISGNLRGLWIQKILEGAGVSLHNGLLVKNSGVGIGVAESSRGVVICKTAVKGTLSQVLPVFDGMAPTAKEVGDGLNWLDSSDVFLEQVTLDGNARQSLLIDGPVTGNIVSITLTGGDEMKPALQQNLMAAGAQPMLGGGVNLMSQETQKFAVPLALSAPALP
jgi:hypothetical protein